MTIAVDDIVERVARAICDCDPDAETAVTGWTMLPDRTGRRTIQEPMPIKAWQRFEAKARLAIAEYERAALATAGPGREKTIEECARRIDNSVFASSSRSRAIAFKDAAKIIRALASQPAKPVPVEPGADVVEYLAGELASRSNLPHHACVGEATRIARALLAMAGKRQD